MTYTAHHSSLRRLRDRDEVGSTFIRIRERWAHALESRDSKLMLVGMGEYVVTATSRRRVLQVIGRDNVLQAQPKTGASLFEAHFA
jgi:hypothetical protein